MLALAPCLTAHHMQVYVTVYADGPTRVLQFSDEPTLANSGYDLSIVDLAARTKQASLLSA